MRGLCFNSGQKDINSILYGKEENKINGDVYAFTEPKSILSAARTELGGSVTWHPKANCESHHETIRTLKITGNIAAFSESQAKSVSLQLDGNWHRQNKYNGDGLKLCASVCYTPFHNGTRLETGDPFAPDAEAQNKVIISYNTLGLIRMPDGTPPPLGSAVPYIQNHGASVMLIDQQQSPFSGMEIGSRLVNWVNPEFTGNLSQDDLLMTKPVGQNIPYHQWDHFLGEVQKRNTDYQVLQAKVEVIYFKKLRKNSFIHSRNNISYYEYKPETQQKFNASFKSKNYTPSNERLISELVDLYNKKNSTSLDPNTNPNSTLGRNLITNKDTILRETVLEKLIDNTPYTTKRYATWQSQVSFSNNIRKITINSDINMAVIIPLNQIREISKIMTLASGATYQMGKKGKISTTITLPVNDGKNVLSLNLQPTWNLSLSWSL